MKVRYVYLPCNISTISGDDFHKNLSQASELLVENTPNTSAIPALGHYVLIENEVFKVDKIIHIKKVTCRDVYVVLTYPEDCVI